jgi:acyl carrier protein
MWFMKARQAARFKSRRVPQSDKEFITRCGLDPGTTTASLALVVRRVIGECGSLEPTYIHHDDRWPEELGKLDFWDSIDFLQFVFSVECATGLKFHRDDDLQDFFYSGFSVSELIQRVVTKLERRKARL